MTRVLHSRRWRFGWRRHTPDGFMLLVGRLRIVGDSRLPPRYAIGDLTRPAPAAEPPASPPDTDSR